MSSPLDSFLGVEYRALDAFYERFPRADEAMFVGASDFEARLDALAAPP